MKPANQLTSNQNDYCFAYPGKIYAVYLPEGGTTKLDIREGLYEVRWYDPRHGGDLQIGTIDMIKGPGMKSIGFPPQDRGADWSVLIRSEKMR